jgi:hypothetical protein
MRTRLEEMGHPQTTATPIKTDNENSTRFANKNIKRRLTKHMDMRYHWVQDRVAHGEIKVYWAPGSENLADYFTKHHHPIYHRRLRHKYLQAVQDQYSPHVQYGCQKQPAVGSTDYDTKTEEEKFANSTPTTYIADTRAKKKIQRVTPSTQAQPRNKNSATHTHQTKHKYQRNARQSGNRTRANAPKIYYAGRYTIQSKFKFSNSRTRNRQP